MARSLLSTAIDDAEPDPDTVAAEGLRFVLGPWRWMLLIYEYLEGEDRVVVVTIQDTGTSAALASQ